MGNIFPSQILFIPFSKILIIRCNFIFFPLTLGDLTSFFSSPTVILYIFVIPLSDEPYSIIGHTVKYTAKILF